YNAKWRKTRQGGTSHYPLMRLLDPQRRQKAMATPEDEARRASSQFYAALNSMANGDAGPMSAIMSHSETATTMHPLGGREVGWDQVAGPWGQVAQLASGGQVTLTDQLIQAGSDMAYETGVEKGEITL